MDEKRIIHHLKSDNADLVNQALQKVYDQYYKLVCFIIGKFIQNTHDLEELANDVFISLYLHRENLDDSRNLKYYISASAKNKALNFIKKMQLTTELLAINEFNEIVTSINSHPDYESVVSELSEVLSKEEIEILLKHLVEGYSFSDLSRIKDLPMNTLKSKYRRSLKKFHKWRKENEKRT